MATKLKELRACTGGQEWADAHDNYREAWEKCKRGDWMLWIAKKRDIDLRILTKAKVECAKLAEHLMTDERSINALRVAERFAEGNATKEELNTAANAAAAAYATYAAANAADAAADAIYAADAAANAAYAAYAADAAYAAADAAYAAAAYAAADAADAAYAAAYATRDGILSKSADICRKYIDFDLLNME